MKERKAAGSDRRGQGLAELAMVLPLMMVVFCSILEFGWYYHQLVQVNNACRTGVAVGMQQGPRSNNSDVTSAVSASIDFVSVTAVNISVSTNTGTSVANTDRTTGNYITVQVVSPYNCLTGIVNLGALAGISQITASNTMIISP